MASQKHWQDEMISGSESLGSDTEEEDLLSKQEAEDIFRFECQLWIKNNSKEILNSPFKKAYKKPWQQKTLNTEDGIAKLQDTQTVQPKWTRKTSSIASFLEKGE